MWTPTIISGSGMWPLEGILSVFPKRKIPLLRFLQESLHFFHQRALEGRCDAVLKTKFWTGPLASRQLSYPGTCTPGGVFGGRGQKHLLPGSPRIWLQSLGFKGVALQSLSYSPECALWDPVSIPRWGALRSRYNSRELRACAGGTEPGRDRGRGGGLRAPVTAPHGPRPAPPSARRARGAPRPL